MIFRAAAAAGDDSCALIDCRHCHARTSHGDGPILDQGAALTTICTPEALDSSELCDLNNRESPGLSMQTVRQLGYPGLTVSVEIDTTWVANRPERKETNDHGALV